MKTVIYTQYGPPEVLHVIEAPKPLPKEDEVLVRVHATTVTIGDTIMRSLRVPGPWWQRLAARIYLGIGKPKRRTLGMELAGQVESTGEAVTRFQPGDPVFASTFAIDFGGYAEYKCLPETGVLAIKPSNLSYAEAAAVPGGGMTALQCLRNGNLQAGQQILIYGASGAVGTYAVQLASQHFEAEVTGVCSTANVEMVRSLGATHIVDYMQQDFSAAEARYDIVFDAVGKASPAQAKQVLRPGGTYLNVHTTSDGSDSAENLCFLKDLIEAGKLRPVIDRCYTLDEIVEAHRYVDQGHKRGNVVITVA